MTESTYIRSLEEPEMGLLNQGGSPLLIGSMKRYPVLPYVPITDKDRDEWNAKWGGEGAESVEEMEDDNHTEQDI